MLLTVFAFTLHSQSFEVGVYGGLSYYDGDLGPNELILYFQTLRPAGGVLARTTVGKTIGLRLSYNYLTIMGDDAISDRRRGLSFETNVHEFAVSGELNLFRLYLFGDDFHVEPYLYGGAAWINFNPRTRYEGEWVELQPLGTEGQGLDGYPPPYELSRWALLAGGGVKLHVSPRFVIGLEMSGRKTFTDYLDDVGNQRVTYQDVLEGNGELAARLSRPSFNPDRDDPTRAYLRGGKAEDYIITGGVTLTYRFGPDVSNGHFGGRGRVKCPTFK